LLDSLLQEIDLEDKKALVKEFGFLVLGLGCLQLHLEKKRS